MYVQGEKEEKKKREKRNHGKVGVRYEVPGIGDRTLVGMRACKKKKKAHTE